MKTLMDDLEAIEAHLVRLHRPVASLMQPGSTLTKIVEVFSKRGLALDDDMATLYRWRNGTRIEPGATIDDLSFVPGFYFLSLEDALLNFDQFARSPRWEKSWVPLLANGGGDFLAIDLSEKPTRANVRHFRIEESDHPIEYENLADMMKTFRIAYDRAIFFVHSGGYLEMDSEAYGSLAAEFDPSVAWWRD